MTDNDIVDFGTEFNLDEDLIHLNHAAVGPWPRCTVNAINAFAAENLRCGSWHYPKWIETESRLRQHLATMINAPDADDIALVKNTSEALSFVAAGINWQAGDNIVSSSQEFPSNRIVWESLSSQGVELRQADLAQSASPEDALFGMVDSNTRMLSISSVQYGTGLKMDLQRIGTFCRERGILFCVDAIQSVGAMHFDVQAIHADFVAADGHKWLLGPEGLGFLYVRAALRDSFRLTQFGWHMVEAIGDFERVEWQPASTARRFECGSPNMLSIHALNASVSLLLEVGLATVEQRVLANSRILFDALSQLPGVSLLTPTESGRFAGIVTFQVEAIDMNGLHASLHRRKVFCARRGGGIRFSPHYHTPTCQLKRAVSITREEIIKLLQ